MVGRKSISPSRPVNTQGAQDAHPPSYSDIEADQACEPRAYMSATTNTTVTTTTQTTTFFSLPLWRRRAGPSMAASALSEGPHSSVSLGRTTEDGRIARASSCNVDLNKNLPDIPHYEEVVDSAFARRSTGTMQFPVVQQGTVSGVKSPRTSRSSTLMPPQAQSARSLAQAGLGIGLPYVMPSVANSARGSLHSSSMRPSTAPRPARLEPTHEVRRVKSFTRAKTGLTSPDLNEDGQGKRAGKNSPALSFPNGKGADSSHNMVKETSSDSPSSRPESKSLMRRASFWGRRRVQSTIGPPGAPAHSEQDSQMAPLPNLPLFKPISPMFPERPVQSSPGPTPRSSTFQSSGRLRRRHSERSTSTHQSSPSDSHFSTDPPPIPGRSPHRPRSPVVTAVPRSPVNGSSAPLHAPYSRPVHPSFVSTPAISRFSIIDERQARPRSMTNPPSVLQRLSMGFFNSSSPSSPISSTTLSTNIMDDIPVSSSPRHSGTLLRSSLSKSAVEIPKPRADEESPEVFLGRLEEAVSKAEIANILAGSGDLYYTQALQSYIGRFNFTNDPLDIALRKLLMDVGLPKETQQIDRVMEAFAAQYTKCNPDLFMSQDHPYILAFSLIMLHTDAFNKSNKHKMSKADYIKNTKLVGVSTEVLDYFFDNIVFAPFIFIEDPVDVNGQRGLTQDGKSNPLGGGQMTPTLNGSGLTVRGKSNKVDAYYLITRNLLDTLRVDVESYIPLRNPFSYQGTAGSWNEAELRRSFARADMIEIDALDARRMSTLPFFSMNVSGTPGPLISNFAPPVLSDQESILSEYSSLKATKVGLLNRKDDLLDGGKRGSNRKWKEWSIILTGSQLLFYRDSAVALNLIVQSQSPESETFPAQPSFLRPDELLLVKDAIAVYDSSYVKRDYVVRLVMSSGRQILLQTENETQRNEWIAHINYASAFKTAGIRMRPVSATENARMDRSSYTHDAPQIPSESTMPNSNILSGSFADNKPPSALVVHSDDPRSLPTQMRPVDVSTNVQSRSWIVLSKIQEFESKITTTRTQLESDIRFAHNLAILTPFQRSTRDRLQAVVNTLGRHIRQLRLEIVKATCFRDVLAADLASEEREQKSRRREESEQRNNGSRTRESPMPSIPLSIDEGDALRRGSGLSLSRSDVSELSHGQPDSSICESFHSALDFGSDWPRSNRPSTGLRRIPSPMRSFDGTSPLGTPCHEAAPGNPMGSSFFPTPAETSSGRASSISLSIAAEQIPVVDSRVSEEQAEEWDKTRAARRVSLVKVPTGLKSVGPDGHRKKPRLGENDQISQLSDNEEEDAALS